MTRAKTPKARANLRISFRSGRKMRAVVEALKPELTHPAGEKARAAIIVRGNVLNLRFEAKDAATLRAILSSYLRMLAASLNVCEIIHQLETADAVQESGKG